MKTKKTGYIIERAGRQAGVKHRIFGIHFHVSSEHKRIEAVEHEYARISAPNKRDALALYAVHKFGGTISKSLRVVVRDEGPDPHTPQPRAITEPTFVTATPTSTPVTEVAPQPQPTLMTWLLGLLANHPKTATA
jgi:hypothetical protein